MKNYGEMRLQKRTFGFSKYVESRKSKVESRKSKVATNNKQQTINY